jgi:glucosylglycerate synthase
LVGIDGISEDTKQNIEQLGTADMVIGLAGVASGEPIAPAVAAACEAVQSLRPLSATAVVVHPDSKSGGQQASVDCPANGDGGVRLLACPLPLIAGFPEDVKNLSEAYRILFSISRGLGARACWLLSSRPGSDTAEVLRGLIEPVMTHSLDVIVPSYARKKFDGLINSSIIYPLTRALYGKRIYSPMSPDLGVSARFIERWLQPSGSLTRPGSVLLMTTTAVREGFQVGQVHLGPRSVPPREISDLSTVLSQVLDSLFTEVENTAAIWQRTRGSHAVPSFGRQDQVIDDGAAADVRKLIDAFQLGYRNLFEVWARFLPPETLVELKRLTRMSPEQFHLPDEYWVRIVYDCALGQRLRVINRDHLLRSMTPIYLAWVASYVIEVQKMEAAAVQERLEKLCMVYEQQKSYLVSRWRWPDRFRQ